MKAESDGGSGDDQDGSQSQSKVISDSLNLSITVRHSVVVIKYIFVCSFMPHLHYKHLLQKKDRKFMSLVSRRGSKVNRAMQKNIFPAFHCVVVVLMVMIINFRISLLMIQKRGSEGHYPFPVNHQR